MENIKSTLTSIVNDIEGIIQSLQKQLQSTSFFQNRLIMLIYRYSYISALSRW